MKLLCCEALEALIETAGDQGIGVVARRQANIRKFFVQFRAVAKDDTDRLVKRLASPTPPEAQSGITLMAYLPLAHCPSCGANLRKAISKNSREFDQLVAAHEKFTS